MEKQNLKAWLYLLPAFLFLGAFMIYPLIDVFVYSFEEGYNSASQTFYGIGMYNYSYVLHDPYFLQALKNTFILVIITVPVSTGLALLISAALSSIKPLRDLFQTIFFRFSHEASERHDRFDLYFIISGKIYRKLLHCICDVIFHIAASFPAFKHCRERNHPLPHTKWYFIVCLYIQKADI